MEPRILRIAATLTETGAVSAESPPETRTATPERAAELLRRTAYDGVVLELPLPGRSAADLVEEVRRSHPSLPVLIHDPRSTLAEAARLARLQGWQLLDTGATVQRQLEALMEQRRHAPRADPLRAEEWERQIVGSSPEMRRVCHLIRLVGPRRATVLITGETGSGKEVAARALHLAGPRRRGPFVAVNCGALPESLLEAELFGHVRGAFTGALQNRAGRFEAAHEGTLLLDEIGEMPLELQAKLLRVLQEREFQRLGSSETVRADVRVVAATNCELERRVAQGRFREDLYYRLNVVPLRLPPLRQRRGDIPALVAHLLERVCREERLPPRRVSDEALERLAAFSWPGNIRQLENSVEMAVALSGERTLLGPADFPLPALPPHNPAADAPSPVIPLPEGGLDYEETLGAIERSILGQALERTGGNKKAAAEMLRLKRTTLAAKVRSLVSVPCN